MDNQSAPRFDALGRLAMTREEFATGEYTLVEGDAAGLDGARLLLAVPVVRLVRAG